MLVRRAVPPSLAPSVTELLFAAGGGARIVGAVNYRNGTMRTGIAVETVVP